MRELYLKGETVEGPQLDVRAGDGFVEFGLLLY